MPTANTQRFAALSLAGEPGDPGSRGRKKAARAQEHRCAVEGLAIALPQHGRVRRPLVSTPPAPHAACTPPLPSCRGGSSLEQDSQQQQQQEEPPSPPQAQQEQQRASPPASLASSPPCYTLALAGDNLLLAVEAGSGAELACFAVEGPEEAADPQFLGFVRRQVEWQLRQRRVARQQHQHAAPQQQASQQQWEQQAAQQQQQQRQHASQQQQRDGDAEVEALLELMLGGGTSAGGRATSPGSPGSTSSNSGNSWATAEEHAEVCHAREAQAQADDWALAAALAAAEVEEEAAAAAAMHADAAAAWEAALAGEDAEERAVAADLELALRWQQDEDVALAAALAAEEEEGGRSAAVAASPSNFWSRLRPGSADAAPLGSSSCCVDPGAFPSLAVAAAHPSRSGAGTGSNAEQTRLLLLRQHLAAHAASLARGSGVRLLHRAVPPSPEAPPLLPRGAGGGGGGGGLPPLQVEGGLRLHEDDLDWQLLLRVRHKRACTLQQHHLTV